MAHVLKQASERLLAGKHLVDRIEERDQIVGSCAYNAAADAPAYETHASASRAHHEKVHTRYRRRWNDGALEWFTLQPRGLERDFPSCPLRNRDRWSAASTNNQPRANEPVAPEHGSDARQMPQRQDTT